jgi:signal transduction histidine kinase
VQVTLELLEGVPAIEADREEMRRLFTNLVDNAIKYNREGGAVRVAVGARLAGQQTDGFVAVEVSDTGIGIPRGAIERLGEAFYRVRTADTLQITGTGLGLSICKQIIEAHNGHLEIESEEGKGSTFRVLLPRSGAGAVK